MPLSGYVIGGHSMQRSRGVIMRQEVIAGHVDRGVQGQRCGVAISWAGNSQVTGYKRSGEARGGRWVAG